TVDITTESIIVETDYPTTETDDITTESVIVETDAPTTDAVVTSATNPTLPTTQAQTTVATSIVSDVLTAAATPLATTAQLYPHGYNEGDTKLRDGDDITSNAIRIPRGLFFGHRKYRNFYVSSNGLISFGRAYRNYW
ncbi:unnamed protein product, partial [Owenia fusiformis]